jgi:DNA-binding beta-propeller fold protein YncE
VATCCGHVFGWDTVAGAATTPATISAGSQPQFLAINPVRDEAYVTNFAIDQLTTLDLALGVQGPLINPVGDEPYGVAVTPDGTRALVANSTSGDTSIVNLDTDTLADTIDTPTDSYQVAISPNQPPTASFTTTRPVAGRATTFDASASTDPEGNGISEYIWDFGDGQTQTTTQPVVQHTYAQGGSVTATLRLTDAAGCASEGIVYTGQTASCNGSAANVLSRQLGVGPVPGTIGSVTATPKKKKAKAGSKATFFVSVSNDGPGILAGLKVCADGPKGTVRIPCRELAPLPAGQSIKTRFKARIKRSTPTGKKIKLTFTASADENAPKTARGRVKVG